MLVSNLKMKYRLLFIILLPTLFLVGLVGYFLWNDYKETQEANNVQSIMVLSGDIANLGVSLEAEEGISKIRLTRGNVEDQELFQIRQNIRQTVDTQIAAIKESADKTEVSRGGKSTKALLQQILSKLELLNQKRTQVDAKTGNIDEITSFFEGAKNACFEVLSQIADLVVESKSVRSLYELLIITEERVSEGVERVLLYNAFADDEISQENYAKLLQEMGKQIALMKSFDDMATLQEEQLYRSTIKGENVNEANRMGDLVIAMGSAGKFGVRAKDWWAKQSEKMNLFEDFQNKLIAESNNNLNILKQEHLRNLLISVLLIAITLAIAFFLVFQTLRSISKKLQEEIDVLAVSGEEILRSITEAASGTTETATAVTETTTTVEELKQTAQTATEKAKNVADVSDEALKTLKNSEKSIEDTIKGMTRIHDGMDTISESIVKLSEHSQMIGEIIDTVNDLAEQSHLLAVNAAIEAAKAGDQGKGFAVVAQEVRSLAEQSKQATIQVRNILNDIQNSTSKAVMATEQGSKSVSQGLAQSAQTNESISFLSLGINKVAQAATQISLSSQQQLVGVDQVTIAMTNIKDATNQQVDHMQQIEGGVQGLNAVGLSLKQLVQKYF